MSTSRTDPEPQGEHQAPAWLKELGQGMVDGLNQMHADQATQPRKIAAQEWAQGAVEKLNRMRTDEAYRQEIAAKTK
ncbi:MAG TPA: hypothetical protein VM512_09405 [Burkholderiaceae bacterium]|jgi:hypothetical protein|nr:hypothetical protein [Burkholderiaceae bacterium]